MALRDETKTMTYCEGTLYKGAKVERDVSGSNPVPSTHRLLTYLGTCNSWQGACFGLACLECVAYI